MTTTKLQQQFTAANDKGDLVALLRLARTQAREILLVDGLDSEDEIDRINALAGDFKPAGVDVWETYCRHLKAAYMLGIAVGQLVHPAVFEEKGGHR